MNRFGIIGLYGQSALETIAAKIVFYSSSFIALWMATQILSKPDYGSYAFAVAVMWFASVPVSLGLDQTVLVRAARDTNGDGARGLISSALLTALAVGSALAIILALAAKPLAQLAGVAELEFWLRALSATIPLFAIGSLCESWYIARGDAWRGQIFPALGHAMRVPVMALALLVGGSQRWIVAAEILVGIIPILLFLFDRTRPRLTPPTRVARADAIFGARLLVARVANEGIRRIDIFMLGALATALTVADYSIAARLVVALDLGRELLQPAFTARVGRFLALADRPAAAREYDLNRAVSLLFSLAFAGGMVLLAKPFLALFGDFASAFLPMMILIAGGLVNAAFGPNGQFLKIAGHATWLLNIRVAMLVVLILGNLVLIPEYGAVGAAFASMFAITLVNLLFWYAIRNLEQTASMDARTLLVLAFALGTVALVATDQIPPWAGAIILGVIAMSYAWIGPLRCMLTSLTFASLFTPTEGRFGKKERRHERE
jgi:O-antigen/teichoic acid export membrane protein